MMRSILTVAVVGVLAFIVAACASDTKTDGSSAAAPGGKRPNVVFILTDDQRWNCLGLAKDSVMATPHIDRIGREGVYFPNAFCTTSLCSPSRASILSGMYAKTHGVSGNFIEYPEHMPSFPRQLQKAGYQTAYIGKYHMGEENDDKRPGFDHFVTHKGQGKYFDTEFRFNGGERRVVPGYYTTVVTDMALDWFRGRDKSKPFMLFVGHKAPHSFYFPEEKYKHAFDHVEIDYPHTAYHLDDNPAWYAERIDTWHGIYGPIFEWRKQFPDTSARGVLDFQNMVRAYRGTILSVDDSVGRLYRALEEAGELDNTIFVFTGDNGLLEGEHGMVDKRTMHEASIRVPLVVRYPGLVTPSRGGEPRVVEQQVLTIDFAPTLIELCGAEPLAKVHGRSWAKLVREGDSEWRQSWYYECDYEKQFPYTPNVRGVRTDRWKYIRYPHGDGGPDRIEPELFDIANDPHETKNLVRDPAYSGHCKRLAAELDSLMDRVEGSRNMPVYDGVKKELPAKEIR